MLVETPESQKRDTPCRNLMGPLGRLVSLVSSALQPRQSPALFTNRRSAPVAETLPPANSNGKRGGPASASHAGRVYRRRFVSTRLAATLLADGAPCFAICACPALVIKRDCSYISIHFSLEIAEIRLPIASSGKSSDDSK